MAPPSYKQYSEDFINLVMESEEPYEVGKTLGIPKSTLATILKRGRLLK